jgi:hypothetical protein
MQVTQWVKSKVKLSMFVSCRHTGRVRVYHHQFLNFALDGAEWSASCSGHFTPLTKSSRCLLNKGLGGPQKLVWTFWRKENLMHFFIL